MSAPPQGVLVDPEAEGEGVDGRVVVLQASAARSTARRVSRARGVASSYVSVNVTTRHRRGQRPTR